MITNYNTFINEAKGLGLDAYNPQELGRIILKLCDARDLSIDKVKNIINAGADLDLQDDEGHTALHLTAIYGHGHIQIAQALIRAGAFLHLQDIDGYTPLHIAAQNGHFDITKALIKAGAPLDLQDLFGWTALHWAANQGHTKTAQLLLASGASKDIKNFYDQTPWDRASEDIQEELPELKP